MPCPTPDENSRCIIAVTCGVHKPNPNSDFGDTLAYYCAGDGNKEVEDILSVYFAKEGLRMDTMKATHHGSMFSFSHSLFEALRPVSYVISAGTAHGHPCEFLQHSGDNEF